jgi:hypothetical protein
MHRYGLKRNHHNLYYSRNAGTKRRNQTVTLKLYRITGPSLKSAPEMLEEFAGIDTGSEALTNRQPSLASFK